MVISAPVRCEDWNEALLESLNLVERSVGLRGFIDHISRCEDTFRNTDATADQHARLAEFKARAQSRITSQPLDQMSYPLSGALRSS